jgi:hypothetical protein
MGSTTTQISIINRGLQLLGAPSINSLADNNRGARAMNVAYQPTLEALLRSYFWNFAIKRAQLVAAAVGPLFGKANAYPLPGDFIMLAPNDQYYAVGAGQQLIGSPVITDWQIEGNTIVSDDPSPINIRYVSSNITEANFDFSFAEALSADLAVQCAEAITQSATKVQQARVAYKDAIDTARQRKSFEDRPVRAPVSSWILARL